MRIKMPAVRIAQADAEGMDHQDILTCGACQKPFALSDIVRFIQHKIAACNKENFHCFEKQLGDERPEGGLPLLSSKRPSISAPMKKASGSRVHTPPASPRLPAPADLGVDGAASSTPKRRASPPADAALLVKQERMDSTEESRELKKSRIEVVDAESNTTHSEPSNYVCSTCKQRLHSAWRLLQHVQHSHGIKIYIESSPTSSSKSSNNHSTSSASSTSSGCSSSGPPPPPSLRHHLLPPPDLHNPFNVGNLLRLPLPPLNHTPIPPAPLFSSRPDHHYQQLVNEQFRHHGLNLAAAAAAAAVAAQNFPTPPDRTPPLGGIKREPTTTTTATTNSTNVEPQLDFYSQRLRQLAGTTSPGAAQASSPCPRKHSPPFSPLHHPPTNTSGSSTASNNNNNNSTSPPTLTAKEELIPRAASTPPGKPGSPSAEGCHSCDLCGKKFRYAANLEAHRRAHNGDLPYKCTVCEHACAHSSKLKRHMKLHRTPEDRTSNAGSVETLDSDDDEELDEEEEEEDLEEEEAEDLRVPSQTITKNSLNHHHHLHHHQSASLVGELMDKFGLSNIAQYSEAYKQALQESTSNIKLQLGKNHDNNNSLNSIKLRDEFAKSLLPGPPPQLPLFPPFSEQFDGPKRMKLEPSDWWLPSNLHRDKILPGTSSLLPNALKKEASRRNDTCEYCGKVFKNCSNLTVHRRSHTGEKPYKCELCSYACAQSSKLTRHMKTHGRIGKDVYRCRFCEMPFSVPSTLEKHMRKCVVNQGKGHLLATMPMLSGDEDSLSNLGGKEAT